MEFVNGGLAASGASIFSNPFDVLKTRMQLQGELKAKGKHTVFYRNTIHAGYVIAKNEGLLALQKGLGTALIMHSVRNSIRLGLYQFLHKRGYLTNSDGKTVLYKSFLASAFSGGAGAVFGSPLFLIKTQLQSQAAQNIAVGYQHKHSGLIGAFRSIYKENGIKGLFRGVSATVLRAVVGSSAQLTTFALTKDYLREIELLNTSPTTVSILASLISGVVQTVMMNPFDLVSIRLYNQGVGADGKGLLYNNIGDCFVKIWKTEGFFGFYKGIGPNYMRLAPHGVLCLVFWDLLNEAQRKYLSNDKIT